MMKAMHAGDQESACAERSDGDPSAELPPPAHEPDGVRHSAEAAADFMYFVVRSACSSSGRRAHRPDDGEPEAAGRRAQSRSDRLLQGFLLRDPDIGASRRSGGRM